LSRTGAATAALAVAVATAVGVGLMVESFRLAVSDWLEQLLQADVYVVRPAETGQGGAPLPAGLVRAAVRLPGVEAYSLARYGSIESAVGRIELLAMQPAYAERPAFRFKAAAGRDVWRRFMQEEVLVVSEPFATRHKLEVGDSLALSTPRGERRFPIAGVFFDYRSDQGLAVLRRDLYERIWGDSAITSLGLFLRKDMPVEAVRRDLLALGSDALIIRSNREIRDASMETFRRTFAVTHVLRLLAIAVAFIGILSALLALQLERTREFAILRAVGLTPRQLAALVLGQTGFLGLIAGLLAVPLGLLLAYALVAVINLRSFGWSMELAIPKLMLWQAPVLALAAALLAGIYPAWRAGRMRVGEGLREE
jgi:putative ABC transport system permease protein